ncbi:LacI family DNA-binding transcriptional regulator [Thermatribacter velox]|uniref:LacI family DNA-binding transcriptional regulator n=1 Tax=Thermatribacter velox TaxID=3039681 RepID=A0ABZ2YE40_9BACT
MLNNRYDVSQETRKRILAIIEELGYAPNHLARSLRMGQTKTIGVVISDVSNPFFGSVISGIENILREEGYCVLLYNANEDAQREEEVFKVLLERRVDGVIITPVDESNFSALLSLLQKANIPCVFLARYAKNIPVSYVIADDLLGSFLATEHLLKKGHKRILYLGGPPFLTTSQERIQGYKKALEQYGLPSDENLIKPSRAKMEDGYKIVKEALFQKLEFTAIASFNDYLAFGALRALRENGLSVPRDVAVVGYDDVEFASISWVPLTTVRMPKYELGVEAAKILLSHIRGEAESIKKVVLKPKLIVRSST